MVASPGGRARLAQPGAARGSLGQPGPNRAEALSLANAARSTDIRSVNAFEGRGV